MLFIRTGVFMNYLRFFTDLVFPPRCPGCGGIISFGNRFSYYEGKEEEASFLHRKCRARFEYNDRSFCKRCGTPVEEGKEFCLHCMGGMRSFEEGRSVFLYQGSAKDAMMEIKYKSAREYCEFFGFAAAAFLGSWIRSRNIGILVPVPVHPQRRRQRGYNQAEELAVCIGRRLGIPVRADILLRVGNTKAQKELNPEERRMNLMGAFDIGKQPPPDTAILLVDDIYTTGATMDMCAWTLKTKGNAAKVYCLSICAAVHLC